MSRIRAGAPDHQVMNEPFEAGREAGAKPDLPGRIVLSFPLSSQIHDMWAAGMRLAADQRGLAFDAAIADTSTERQIAQVARFLEEGIGGLEIDPNDTEALRQVKQEAVDAGVVVCGSASGPTALRVQPNFYADGFALGQEAARWITERLDGAAKVVQFIHGHFGPVDRDRGVEDAVRAAGSGVEFINLEPPKHSESKEGSFAYTTELLSQHPDIDVWLGPDRMMVGTLAALEAAGKADNERLFIGGFDGPQEALDRISEGTAYRASIGLPSALIGYATGQFMADWLEGKTIPQILCADPAVLTSTAEIAEFRRRFHAVEEVPKAFASLTDHFFVAGNISYETRDRYIQEDF